MKRFLIITSLFSTLLLSSCGKEENVIHLYVTEEITQSTEAVNTASIDDATPTDTGDFDITDSRWAMIRWDADADGTEEEISFKFVDQGDEAPSVVEIDLYKDEDAYEAFIDMAYGINSIYKKEDTDGQYLLINYKYGDYYSTKNAECTLRFIDGDIKLDYIND